MTDPGYLITENVLSASECDQIVSALADYRDRGRAGARHLMKMPAVASLANDSRLLAMAADTLGGQAVPYRATMFEKSGKANWLVVWHQDTALPLMSRVDSNEWGPWSIKAGIHYAHAPTWALERIVALRVHLDPSTSANGPLRVIEGSYRSGVLTDEEVYEVAHRSKAVECVVGRGGVMSMRPLLIHSSSKVREDLPRRVVHIEYVDNLDLGPSLRLAVA